MERPKLSSSGRKWGAILVTGAAVLAVMATALWMYVSNPLLSAMERQLAPLNLGLYSSLGEWEAHFGPAVSIEQADGINSFFYWPDHGLAVFCHPLFETQHRRQSLRELQVTSILIPLRHQFEFSWLIAKPGTHLVFQTLRKFPVGGRDITEFTEAELRKMYLFRFQVWENEVTLSNSPFPSFARSETVLHFSKGDLVLIEMSGTDLLFRHYD